MSVCGKCGNEIRFIKRKGKKALIVNVHARYFIPDESSREEFVLTNGKMRKGRIAADGLKGFTLHQC